MAEKNVLLIGAKETFLIKVLEKKIIESGANVVFAPWSVDSINQNWAITSLVILYMDTGDLPKSDIISFLSDKMRDDEKGMFIIGDKNDILDIQDRFDQELIYKIFYRPLDNEDFVKTLGDVLNKIQAGEFKKSILVVDDDANYLGIVREWLKNDYKVSMVSSGMQAIKWLGKNKADLILLDHEMPVTSGPQVLEMLRADSETSSIPVIFLTGKGDKESVMKVVALKPEGYFLKTIQKDELLKNLEEFFLKRK